ncbi:MAG: hypothetical protein MJE77_26205 [Proteobacteria bacterium]|nr:hypothetical protein [Pseudomonadota bacterium]
MTVPVPHLRRGAIARVDPIIGVVPTSLAVFQYNPAELSRTMAAQSANGSTRSGSVPHETISMRVELDAADQMERGDQGIVRPSIYPSLSALEVLIYPSVVTTLANLAQSKLGAIEVIPPQSPVAVLLWGTRVLPVRVTQLGVKETAFDKELNPIRADVDLGLQVLTYDDLGWLNVGSFLYLANQLRREVFAAANLLTAGPAAASSFTL